MSLEEHDACECDLCAGEMAPEDCELVILATEIREHAYNPYSGIAVGAALRTTAGKVYAGVNVENACFGLTICAERNAIAAAVADGMRPGQLLTMVLVTKDATKVSPCGACRQVIAEFAAPHCLVIAGALEEGKFHTWDAADLLPEAFEL